MAPFKIKTYRMNSETITSVNTVYFMPAYKVPL